MSTSRVDASGWGRGLWYIGTTGFLILFANDVIAGKRILEQETGKNEVASRKVC